MESALVLGNLVVIVFFLLLLRMSASILRLVVAPSERVKVWRFDNERVNLPVNSKLIWRSPDFRGL
jgi:hypothetical protein